jgi:hypothetical protein
MVQFSQYVKMAYSIAESKGFADRMRGPGTAEVNQRFMSALAEAYNANNHSEASMAAARRFLEQNVAPP